MTWTADFPKEYSVVFPVGFGKKINKKLLFNKIKNNAKKILGKGKIIEIVSRDDYLSFAWYRLDCKEWDEKYKINILAEPEHRDISTFYWGRILT